MALPTSGPLSFTDIAGELSVSSPYSLRNMSAEANFPTPDAVSDFYGYDSGGGGPSLTQFWITSSFEDPRDACFLSCEIPAWHTGLASYPSTGDTVYTDSSGTTPLTIGFYGFYEAQYGPAKNVMQLSKGDDGAVLNTYQC
jgi:hypothetical protein